MAGHQPWAVQERVDRAACQMGRQGHVVQLQQRMVLRERLHVEDVQRGPLDSTFRQRLDQGRFIHQAAARGVDENRVGLHQGQFRSSDQVERLACQPGVNGYDIRFAQQRLEVDERGGSRIALRKGIVGDNAAAKRLQVPGHEPPHRPVSHQPDRLLVQLGDRRGVGERATPLAGSQVRVRSGNVADLGQNQAHRAFRDRPRVPSGSVQHADSALCSVFDGDIFNAGPQYANDAQLRRHLDDSPGERCELDHQELETGKIGCVRASGSGTASGPSFSIARFASCSLISVSCSHAGPPPGRPTIRGSTDPAA